MLHALRVIRKAPGFSAGVIATVMLAIGANAAIFSVAHAVLLRQLPFRDPERLIWIWSRQPFRDKAPFNVPDFIDYRDGNDVLEHFSGMAIWNASLTGSRDPERVQGLRVSGDLFDTLGVDATIGRTLRPADDRPAAPRVAVLAYGMWERRFGGQPGLIGAKLVLDGDVYTVVGVLPPSFFFPVRDCEFAVPLLADSDRRRGIRNSEAFLRAVGRLRPGVSREHARDSLTAVAARLQREHPDSNARKIAVTVVPIAEEIVGGFRSALLALMAAVGGVLVIACANLANLTLARGSTRAAEVATRLALGGTRGRIARELLAESMVLAAIGGFLGAIAAAAGISALLALAPPELPRIREIGVDSNVLLFTLAATVLAGVSFGLIPAFIVSKADLTQPLRDAARGSSEGVQGRRVRQTLVATEIGLAVVLTIVFGLFARSFANLQAVKTGFQTADVISAKIALPLPRYPNPQSVAAYQRRMLETLQSLPFVDSAGAVSLLPLSGLDARIDFTVEGRATERDRVPTARYRLVTPAYMRTMGIPVLRGRGFTGQDTAMTRRVVLVNQELTRRFFPGLDPIGAHLLINDNNTGPRPVEIAGVVGDVRQLTLDGDPTLDIYLPYEQVHPDSMLFATSNMFWVVRGRGAPAQEVRRAMRIADPAIPISDLRPLEQSISGAVAPRRFNLLVLAVFAAAALLLSTTGIYATLSYAVSRRTREFAIRSALGAQRRDLMLLIVRQGVAPALAGIALGLSAAFAIARSISSMLFGLSSADPTTFIAVPLLLLAVAVAACVLPGLRASRAAVNGSV